MTAVTMDLIVIRETLAEGRTALARLAAPTSGPDEQDAAETIEHALSYADIAVATLHTELAELREFRKAAAEHVDLWVEGQITPFDAIATIARYLEGDDES